MVTVVLHGAKEVLKQLNEGTLSVLNPSRLFADLVDSVSASIGSTSGILFELLLEDVNITNREKSWQRFIINCFCGRSASWIILWWNNEGIPNDDGRIDSCHRYRSYRFIGVDGSGSLTWDRIDYFDEGSTIAGRSSYLNAETFMNTPNPGAKAVEYILRAIAESASGII
jgi:hypothetical protein